MTRFFPRSLLGQMILLMGAALLVAQLASLAYILREQEKLNLAQNEGPAITRFAETARQLIAARRRDGDWRALATAGSEFARSDMSLVEQQGLRRSPALERRLSETLAGLGVRTASVHAASRIETRQSRLHGHGDEGGVLVAHEHKVAFLSAQLSDGSWLNGRIEVVRPDFWLIHRLILGTAMLYLLVLGVGAWVAIRLARPMRDLAQAAHRFQGREEFERVTPRGPADVKRAIEAFNAMNARVAALLDQKDRMLGAIGHDLRTPLASIRIRAENMGPEEDRRQLFATVDDMAEMLEDILVLARTGRPREPVQRIDIGALADAVVEEFRALGKRVDYRPGPRRVLDVQPSLLRRALRNLVENGCVHGKRVWVSVGGGDNGVEIVVEDDGLGIPAEQLEDVVKPFKRLDPARSSERGGAGLGLTIADAVAQAHGGSLALENRAEGGFRARIVLPNSVAVSTASPRPPGR